jgi:hypothetical protein
MRCMLLLAIFVIGWIAGADAAPGGVPFKGLLTVQFTGSQQCAAGDKNCTLCVQNSGFYIEAQGIADTSLGPLFAEVLKCFYPSQGENGT